MCTYEFFVTTLQVMELCDMKLTMDGYDVTKWNDILDLVIHNASILCLDKFLSCTGEFGTEIAAICYIAHEVKNGQKAKINQNIFTVLPVSFF